MHLVVLHAMEMQFHLLQMDMALLYSLVEAITFVLFFITFTILVHESCQYRFRYCCFQFSVVQATSLNSGASNSRTVVGRRQRAHL